jgi:hypothetical protein
MTPPRWRALAGILVLTIGSIVVLANDKPKVHPACKDDCSCCPTGCTCCPQCPCQACPAPCSAQCPIPCCPPVQCPSQCPSQFPATCDSPVPCQCPVPVAVIPEEPKPAPAQSFIKPVSMMATVATVPYRVRVEMIGAVTQVELLRGEEVTLRVQCDRVDMQMPAGGIQAIGKVCVSATGLDVRCNRMTIGWNAGDISMEGQVQIQCQHGQLRTTMSADSVNCRLNSMGTGLDFNSSEVEKPVRD